MLLPCGTDSLADNYYARCYFSSEYEKSRDAWEVVFCRRDVTHPRRVGKGTTHACSGKILPDFLKSNPVSIYWFSLGHVCLDLSLAQGATFSLAAHR